MGASRLRKYSEPAGVPSQTSGRSSVGLAESKVMKWLARLFTPPKAPLTIGLFVSEFTPGPPKICAEAPESAMNNLASPPSGDPKAPTTLSSTRNCAIEPGSRVKEAKVSSTACGVVSSRSKLTLPEPVSIRRSPMVSETGKVALPMRRIRPSPRRRRSVESPTRLLFTSVALLR